MAEVKINKNMTKRARLMQTVILLLLPDYRSLTKTNLATLKKTSFTVLQFVLPFIYVDKT